MYIDQVFVSGAVLVPQFGDARRDREALEIFRAACSRPVSTILAAGTS